MNIHFYNCPREVYGVGLHTYIHVVWMPNGSVVVRDDDIIIIIPELISCDLLLSGMEEVEHAYRRFSEFDVCTSMHSITYSYVCIPAPA